MRSPRDRRKPRQARAQHFLLQTRADDVDSEAHQHREAQLLYLVRGGLTFEAAGAWWIVPPGSALWLPSGVEHRFRARAPLEGYNVFLAPAAGSVMPAECCAVSVTPLFREVMFRLAVEPDARLAAVLISELAHVSVEKHRLPMPTDTRLQKLIALITAEPGDGSPMKTWAQRVGLAERTLNRLLVRQTGLSFGKWRQQLHIILAIQSLSRGESVQNVASDLGYESASSFVTMFKKALGTSPAKYMKAREAVRFS